MIVPIDREWLKLPSDTQQHTIATGTTVQTAEVKAEVYHSVPLSSLRAFV